jgi:sulfate adenylyltransferase subunit 1
MAAVIPIEERDPFAGFLEGVLSKELLRFTTAGSVDDGKSTLIGRLLHDSKTVYEDQLASVKKSRINRSGGEIDFSLLTDGLRAEREQGITIDVAYRYFSTVRRMFIIADTPGHEQYTRNMATGASTADLAVILVDGTKGLLPQTRRHAYIAALLGIPNVVAAINKMDLVHYREDVFLRLERDFRELARSLSISSVRCIPISALEGDNVVARSASMSWYDGPTLMEHLETVEIRPSHLSGELRFPVQSVIRPDASFRGFAGRVAGGSIRRGDSVLALPSEQRTTVKAIVTFDGEIELAIPQQSVVLQLEDEIDLSRGDLLVSPEAPPLVSNRFAAMVVWLHGQALQLNRTYLAKHAARLVRVKATRIRHRVDINDFTQHPAVRLEMNEIACVEFESSSPLSFDPYARNRTTGSFILIDPLSNATLCAGMIQDDIARDITAQDQRKVHKHLPAIFYVNGRPDVAECLERSLFERGFDVLLLRHELLRSSALPSVLSALWSVGMVIVYSGQELLNQERAVLEGAAGDRFFVLPRQEGVAAERIADDVLAIAETLRVGTDAHNEGQG